MVAMRYCSINFYSDFLIFCAVSFILSLNFSNIIQLPSIVKIILFLLIADFDSLFIAIPSTMYDGCKIPLVFFFYAFCFCFFWLFLSLSCYLC